MPQHKSERFMSLALSQDWEAIVEPKTELAEVSGDPHDIVWHLYAKRDIEALHVIWRGNQLDYGIHTYGDYRRKLWWPNEIRKVLNGAPNMKKACKSAETVEKIRRVPWESDTPAVNIMTAVLNRKVEWVRKIDGEICEAKVDVDLKEPASAKHFRVYESRSGRRMLEWADSLGFHTVALDQIINVA